MSNKLEKKTIELLKLEIRIKVPIEASHIEYLKWHQQYVFKE